MQEKKKKVLTGNFGTPIEDDQNTMTAGSSGPALIQDVHLVEKLAHFDRERIPERVVHAKGAGAPNYYPNSFGGPIPHPETTQPALEVSGKTGRHPYSHPNDDFVQPRELYRKVMNEKERTHLIGNIVEHLSGAKKRIQLRQTALFYKVDPQYGIRVAQGLGLNVEEIEGLAGMTQEERVKATIE